MNRGTWVALCLGIAVALWLSPKTGSAETLNTTVSHADHFGDVETWSLWEVGIQDVFVAPNSTHEFARATEFRFGQDDWEDESLFFANEISDWPGSPVTERVKTSAVPSRIPEPKPWVLIACGLSFLAASAALRQRDKTET